MKIWRSSVFYLTIFSCLIPLATKAQIIPDNSLGEENSVVVPFDEQGVAADVIDGGAVRGASLFHSFQEFNVGQGRGAFFNNPEGINNIFSRVTGTNVSNINGVLGVLGNANLFLINPNGIAFGENAAFSIQGSFYASSADSLLLDHNFEFSASNPSAPPLLEVSIPLGLNFRDNPGDITYNSVASVSAGQTFALVGGNISLNSNTFLLSPLDSRIELGGLTANGNILLNEDGSLVFPDDTTRGDIIFNGAIINIDLVSPSERGGTLVINARNVSLNFDAEFQKPTTISLGIPNGADASESQAGNIIVNAAETFSLDGESLIAQDNSGIGDTGNIEITARNIFFTDGGRVNSFNSGLGNGGEISLTATEDIIFDGVNAINSSGIDGLVFTGGEGNSSNINLTANNLSIINGGSVFSQVAGRGNSGAINLNISNSTIIDGIGEQTLLNGTVTSVSSVVSNNVFAGGVGNSGNINLNTRSLALSNTGEINTRSTGEGNSGDININAHNISLLSSGEISASALGQGSGGNINIDARSISIDGRDNNDPFSSRISSSVFGDTLDTTAGNITIATDSISLTDGGELSASTDANGDGGNITVEAADSISISSDFNGLTSNISALVTPDAVGNGGNIDLSTTTFSIANGILITSSEGLGDAGNINIDATDTFTANNSFILSNVGSFEEVAAVGNVGSIEINAREIALINTAQIQAGLFSGATGDSGTVILNARESISFNGENTGIFANNEVNSLGNASNAFLNAPLVTLDGGAVIEASNGGQGNGGNVTIVADNLTLDRNNRITGSTVSDTGGIVNLQIAQDLVLRSGNEILAQAVNDANGGNLNIDSELIIAFAGNNDIIASADRGNGGNININAESLFGIAERPLNPFTNDINASSEFGLQGNIDINNPAVNPTTGLINLPASVGDASDQISQNPCQQGVGSEFIVTGKGGLPPNPTQTLNSDGVRVGLVEPFPQPFSYEERRERERRKKEKMRGQEENSVTESVPAMGWVFNDKGEVTLTASSNSEKKIERSPQQRPSICSVSGFKHR